MASFLDDAPTNAKNKLFHDSTIRITRFDGNYNILEPEAGLNRMNFVLGIQNFEGTIRALYRWQEGQLNQGNAEVKFFLIAIQMMSGASNIWFMEAAIVRNNRTLNVKKNGYLPEWLEGNLESYNKLHLVKWSTICNSKNKGVWNWLT